LIDLPKLLQPIEVNSTEISPILPMNVRVIFRGGGSMNKIRKSIILKKTQTQQNKTKKNQQQYEAEHETL
jgi:hypothetical protein